MKGLKTTIWSSAILLALFLSSCSAADKFEDYVLAGNYADAISVYRDKLSGNIEKERAAQDFLRTRMNSSLSNYAEGTIDSTSIENIFECLSIIDESLSILEMDLDYGYEDLDVLRTSKENFEKAVAMADKEDYKRAMDLFEKVNEADIEHYTEAKEKLEVVRNKFRTEMLAKTQAAFDSGEYDTAIQLGIEANNCLGKNDVDFQNLVDAAYYEKANVLIDSYIQSGDLRSAIQTYQTFATSHNDLIDAKMSEKGSTCKKDFGNQTIETSKALYFENGAEAALREIENGRSIIEDSRLDALYELYSAAIATSWKDITYHEPHSGMTTNFAAASDYYGNTYQGDLIKLYTFWMYDYPPLEIIPNKRYTKFTTTLVPSTDFGAGETARLKIYGDDILVYDSGAIEKKTKAISVDIDIANVEILKIKLTDERGESVVWLHDTMFCRELTESDIELAIQ